MDPHVTDWLTKPSQVPWTGNQPICQVVYISVFCLHTLLRLSRVYLFFMRVDISRCTKKAKWLQRSKLNNFVSWSTYIVCTLFWLGGWVSYNIFKIGSLTGYQFLEGGCKNRGGDFFSSGRGCRFYIKIN